jgi:hypothetical protein
MSIRLYGIHLLFLLTLRTLSPTVAIAMYYVPLSSDLTFGPAEVRL